MAFIRRHRIVLLPLFLAVLVGAGALLLLRSGSEEPDGTYPRATVQAWQEDVAKRTQHAREYAFVHTVEYLDPETEEVRTEQYTSTVRERGTNICYKDASGEWVPSVAEWVETATGFKMDTNSWQVEVPATLARAYSYTVGGKTLSMQPSYLLLSDGVRTVSLGTLDTTVTGQIDQSDPSKLVFSDVLGVNSGVDIELIAECASLHQNVVLHSKPSLPANFSEEYSRLYVYTELGLDALTADRNIGVKIDDTAVDTAAVDLLTARNERDPIKFTLTETINGEQSEQVLHQFIESRVWDSAANPSEAYAARQLWRNPTDSRTYLVESIDYAYVDGATGPITIDYENQNGTIDEDETWTAEATYYVSGDVSISGTSAEDTTTLTIEPGTVVKFAADTSISIGQYAAIIAEGEPFRYIVFTSDQDDDSGEDLTESATTGTAGDYDEAINIGSSALTSCAIEYCKIGYATDGIAVQCDFGTIKHCIIRSCSSDGIYMTGSAVPDVLNCLIADAAGKGVYAYVADNMAPFRLDNCTIDNCSYGLLVGALPTKSVNAAADTCLFTNNTVGVMAAGGSATCALGYNGWYGNGTDVSGATKSPYAVTLAVSPYDGSTGYNGSDLGKYFVDTSDVVGSDPDGEDLVDAGPISASGVYGDPTAFNIEAPEVVDSDITTTEPTWSKIGTTSNEPGDYGTVDIGYHHPRVDKVIDDTAINIGSSANTVAFKINPGVVVAFSGSSAKLQFKSDATQAMTLTCKGDADDPIVLAGKPLVSMDIEEGYEVCTGLYLATPTGSSTVSVANTRFIGLNFGVKIDNRVSDDEVMDSVFERNHCGLWANETLLDRDVSVRNLLFYRCTEGCRMAGGGMLWGKHLAVYSCTFDECATGLVATYISADTITISDCLYTHCGFGIKQSGSGTWNEDYNAFWDCGTNVQGTLIGAHSFVLLADPYDTSWMDWSDQWYLDQDGACIDAGSGVVQSTDPYINLDTYTTSLDGKLDVATVDIGYHYPGPDGVADVDVEDDQGTDLTDVVFCDDSDEDDEIRVTVTFADGISGTWTIYYDDNTDENYEAQGTGNITNQLLDLYDLRNDPGTHTIRITHTSSDVDDIEFTIIIDTDTPTATITDPTANQFVYGY